MSDPSNFQHNVFFTGINIFTAFFLLLMLLAKSTPEASEKIPLIGWLRNPIALLKTGKIFRSLLLSQHDHDHTVDVPVGARYQSLHAW